MAFEKVKEVVKISPEYSRLIDLASAQLGGKVLYATDDFFAEKENLIKPGRGIFITDKYTDRGKWMDGWESRRKRIPGHDWAVIALATPGKITGFDIDTNFFLGNHPPHASVDGVYLNDAGPVKDWSSNEIVWKEILPKSHLDAGSQNFYECKSGEIFTHVRLHIYPDGGVARFRVYGEVFKNWDNVSEDEEVDLLAAIHGGKAVACNDMFFSAMDNLIMPNRGVNMGDGWETKRNRTPGNRDYVILKLGTPGQIEKIIVDTCHFKGNYPDTCSIDACYMLNEDPTDQSNWQNILPPQKLSADAEHEFKKELMNKGIYTHVKMNIYPDGGISRLRIIGNKKNRI